MKKASSIVLIIVLLSITLTGCSESFTRGVWKDNVYESTFTKLSFTLPDGWSASTDAEIAEQMDISIDPDENASEFMKEILKKQNIIDMMCMNATTKSSIILMFENLAVSGNKKMTVEEYANVLKDQLATQSANGFSYNIDDVLSEKTIRNNTYNVLSATIGDTNASQHYLMRKEGNYIVAAIITLATPDETLDDILKNFK